MEHDKQLGCVWTSPEESRALGESAAPLRFDLDDLTLERWLVRRTTLVQQVVDDLDVVGCSEDFPSYRDTILLRTLLNRMQCELREFKDYNEDVRQMGVKGSAGLIEGVENHLRDITE